MGKYNGAIVTTVGQALIAGAIAGNSKITFTKLKASTHVYASTTDFEAMTSIADIVQSVDISYAGVYNNNVIQVSGQFTNTGVATAFAINTIGLYGKVGNGAETLVAVVTAVNADTMPVADPVSPTSIIYNIQMTVQNSGVMEVEVNDAGTINVHQFNDALYSTAAITVPTTGWTASGSQYTKTIDVGGITSSSMPFVELQYPDNVTATQKKAIDKAASKLVSLTTTNYGQVVLTATEVPATSFNLLLRGLGSGQYTQPYNEFFTTVLDKEPYVSRTARDGLVKLSLIGATVAWNQLVQNGNFASVGNWKARNTSLGNIAVNNNICTYTVSSLTTAPYNQRIENTVPLSIPTGHKALIHIDVNPSQNLPSDAGVMLQSSDGALDNKALEIASTTPNKWNNCTSIYEINSVSQYLAIFFSLTTNTSSVGETIQVKNFYITDLTQMFGTAIADYVYSLEQSVSGSGIAWLKSYGFFTEDYYDYDAGSLQSVCTSERKITALDGTVRTYPIDNEELRGLFKLDANNKLYADGDVYPSSGSGTQKYIKINLGDYNWTTSDRGGRSQTNDNTVKPFANNAIANIICDKYVANTADDVYLLTGKDKTIGINRSGSLQIRDSSFDGKNGTEIKSLLNGVYIVVEATTETAFSADPYINPQRSEGTEEFVDGLTRDVMIPVGNESTYYLSEVLPSAADYTDGQVDELALLKNYTRRTRRDITNDLAYLSRAVAEQNLEKYGYSIGDYFVGASGYTYFLADMDTFYGGYDNSAVVNTHHVSIIVKTGVSSKWNDTDDTTTGYVGSVLHGYMTSTVLDNIKSDMIALFGGTTGLEHLAKHSKLYTNAVSSTAWASNQYISALTEAQVYGFNVWSIDGYQTGEGCKQLEIFLKFLFNQIFGNIWFWLRNIRSASYACRTISSGIADSNFASSNGGVVGLILFK